jgi:hypothetical protein
LLIILGTLISLIIHNHPNITLIILITLITLISLITLITLITYNPNKPYKPYIPNNPMKAGAGESREVLPCFFAASSQVFTGKVRLGKESQIAMESAVWRGIVMLGREV